MKTENIELEPNHASFLQALQKQLRTQDEAFTRTPLYCVYTRASADDPQDGEGWPTSIFLTVEAAETFMKAFGYHLNNPYIYVRSPGEDSELHDLHTLLKDASCFGNGPHVEEETTLYPA